LKSKEYVIYFYYSVKLSFELYAGKLNMYFSFPVTLTPKEKEKEPEKEKEKEKEPGKEKEKEKEKEKGKEKVIYTAKGGQDGKNKAADKLTPP
jgi:hypothetical protein